MNARRALAELMKTSPEWRAFFGRCCKSGSERLCAQVWQFRTELRRRGDWVDLEDLKDALLARARTPLYGGRAGARRSATGPLRTSP